MDWNQLITVAWSDELHEALERAGWWVTGPVHDGEEERLSTLHGPGATLHQTRGLRIQRWDGVVLYPPLIA